MRRFVCGALRRVVTFFFSTAVVAWPGLVDAAADKPTTTWPSVAGAKAPIRKSAVAGDAGDGGGDSTSVTVPTFFEQGIVVRSGEVVQPLGPNLMGDTLNEYSGGLAFQHTDVALPGNNALAVQIARLLNVGTRQAALGAGHFGDWDLDIPRLHTVAFQDNPNWYGRNGLGAFNLNRCSQMAEPPYSVYGTTGKYISMAPATWWGGYQMHVPGVGDQTLYRRTHPWGNAPAMPIQPTDGASYPLLTKQHWQVSCLPTLERGTGEGFVALAPDGTRYRFDHLVQRPYPAMDTVRHGTVPRLEIWILPTLVTDRFGNWVRYTYGGTDGWRVTSITSSDGRSLTLTYSGWGNRIQSVTDGTRTWTYGYDAGGALQTVTQPDGSQWRFALGELERDPFSIEDPGCGTNPNARWDPNDRVGTITHPSGAVGSFTLKMTTHGRSNVPGSEQACEGPYTVNGVSTSNHVSRYFATYALTAKTLSGPGMPAMTWRYAYSSAVGSFAPCSPCAGTKTVTVTDPNGHVVQSTFGTQFGINDGLLLLRTESQLGSVVRATSQTYRASTAGPYAPMVGYEGPMSDAMGNLHTPLAQRTISQQGVAFNQTFNSFDGYARATSVTRASSLGYSRDEQTAFHDNTARWVLGQVARHTVAGEVSTSTTFDSATALPSGHYRFGKLDATFAFNADGTLAAVSDALGRATTLSNFRRGLPQAIRYPDGTTTSAVVHDIGVLTSITNEAGTTWTYGYDAMGRLAVKTPPAGDPVAYFPTTLRFEQVPVAEVGLEPNHWRQTIVTGNAVTVNYFDARWRKRLTTTYDASNRAGTERAQRFDYDPYNRTTFASYPARSIPLVATPVPGTTTAYDVLGRPTQVMADAPGGRVITSHLYLNGFQTQVVNPRGYASTTAYQVFDSPNENAIVQVLKPEGVLLQIARNSFGEPLAITQSNASGTGPTVTRSYAYDAYHRLCRTVEPETGATVQGYDAVDNLAWRASGQPAGTGCASSVPESQVTRFGYDARKRLIATSYGDGSPAITRSYTADGLPYQIASAGGSWAYGYNKLRQLVSETLNAPGLAESVGWGVDAYGHVATMAYADGEVVPYEPDALGQATRVGNYATGVSHHPNGAVAGYRLGNGIVRSVTQDVRGMPALWRDAGVVQDRYTYDANGNVIGITDEQEGLNTRTMGYDGLDRLTTANGPWGSGGYAYDAVDNLVRSVVGARVLSHNIDAATNRLASLTGSLSVGFSYDANGNVRQRGTQTYGFDIANRMSAATGKASYSYDGHGRRTQAAYANGQVARYIYNQAGRLIRTLHSAQGATKHIYLGATLIAEVNSLTGVSYTHTDALGSPVARTNASGQLLSRTRYEPYGATAAGTNPAGVGFTGHVNDPDTGLVYMQQRYYEPMAGKFLSVDPVLTDSHSGGHFGRYHYAENNPLLLVDLDGRQASQGGGFGFGWEVAWSDSGTGAGVSMPTLASAASARLAQNAKIASQLEKELSNAAQPIVAFARIVQYAFDRIFKSEGEGEEKPSLLDAKGEKHVLDGDATGGGHRAGTGNAGKSEFPSDWSDGKVKGEISDIATDPKTKWSAPDKRGYISGSGTRDGVDIKVVFDTRNGRIVTAYPTNSSRNP